MSAMRAPYGGWTLSHAELETGDWSANRRPGTGSTPGSAKIISWIVAASAALAPIGTGGNSSTHLQRVASVGHVTSFYAQEEDEEEPMRSPAEDLARVRDVLSPAISDLAITLKVSRQSIYNWIKGEQVADENAEKLRDLAQAADILAQAGVTITPTLLKRKFAGGKTLLQVAQAGESVQNAALMLTRIHQREAEQRERMNARFAARKKTPATADFDLPASSDDA